MTPESLSEPDKFGPGDRVTRLVFGPNGQTREWRRGLVIRKLRSRYRVDWGSHGIQDHPENELSAGWRN